MTNPDARPDAGTLPGYLSEREVEALSLLPFGSSRLLSVCEESNMLAAGKTREEIADMTPGALANLADATIEQSNNFLGC